MSKHKTRQQKIIAQLRRELYLKSQDVTPSKSAERKLKHPTTESFVYSVLETSSPKTVSLRAHPYLFRDLSKTLILTTAIIAAEILLLFFSKRHILQLPI